MHVDPVVVVQHSDGKPTGLGANLSAVGATVVGGDHSIPGERDGGGVEDGRGVSHRVAHDVLHRHAPLLPVGSHGDPPTRRLETDQSAHGRRDTDRSAPVARVGCRDHARGDSCGGPTGGSARAVVGIPRVVSGAVGVWLRGGYQAQFRGVGSAHDDEAGLLVAGDHVAVRIGGEPGVAETLHSGMVGLAGLLGPQVLDENGHPTERTVG